MTAVFGRLLGGVVAVTIPLAGAAQEGRILTGPETEKRFPPLKLADGFEATLFACDPLIEYPSVIALGPRPGTLLVAQDYMTGLGREIVRRDEIRLIEDADKDGYADRTTLFAEGFNSIQGLAYDLRSGTVFAMHAPFLTMVRDTDGDGVADERRDLLEGLGLPPEKNDTRLHAANGVTVGHDNWLYLALGDHGADVERPEGDRLRLIGGGILRCRPDGSELHIFSTGLRNIYEVALDADLNVFVRDNENDGGDYKVRVYHSFFGADHGYPYKYYERPEETMLPLADLDLGSSAGGVCYLETALPEKYRGNLFFCDWNHSLVRYEVKPKGVSFEPMEEFKVAEGGEGDLYPFKPSDVIVDWDGTLLVSDWADGQRPKRGRGRIYRIGHRDVKPEVVGDPAEDLSGRPLEALMTQLESPSYFVRVLAQREIERRGERIRTHKLLNLVTAETFPHAEPDVLAAATTLHDWNRSPEQRRKFPEVLLKARFIEDQVPLFQDPVFQHSTMQGLRRSENWNAVLSFLDLPYGNPFRTIAIRALGDQAEVEIADDLLNRVPTGRREYIDLLTRIHRKPGPYEYWGYRPAPRPPNTENWERTEAIEAALNRVLRESDDSVLCAFTLRRMQREKIPIETNSLSSWLETERDTGNVALILESLRELPATDVVLSLEGIILGRDQAEKNRIAALEIFSDGARLPAIAKSVEDGPVLATLFRRAGSDAEVEIDSLLFQKLDSPRAGVRAAAIEALGDRKNGKAGDAVRDLLGDPEPAVREAAARAAGSIPLPDAGPQLERLAMNDDTPPVRSASFDALRAIGNGRATDSAVRDLKNRDTRFAALRYLAEFGDAGHATAVVDATQSEGSSEMLGVATHALVKWNRSDEMARLQGKTGMLLRWRVSPAIDSPLPDELPDELAPEKALPKEWKIVRSSGPDAINRVPKSEVKALRFLATDIANPTDRELPIQLLGGHAQPFRVWLNGNPIHESGKFGADPTAMRFNAVLETGDNRLVLAYLEGTEKESVIRLKFRRRSSVAAREELTQAALNGRGNAERGRKLFFDRQRSQCLACHQLRGEGGKIGPELTGMGGRFSKIYLIESILDPNANVTPGFKTLSVIKKDGAAMLGVQVSETESAIVLGDAAGNEHTIPKSDVADLKTPDISLMPAGLENLYSQQEFLDLIAFMLSENES